MPRRRPTRPQRRPPTPTRREGRAPASESSGGRERRAGNAAAPAGGIEFELAVAPGLADLALNELRELARRARHPVPETDVGEDAIAFTWPGAAVELHALRTVQFVSRVWTFPVPRPKALLGDQASRTLAHGMRSLVAAAPAPFTGLRLSAAGRDSAVMRRLAAALAEAAGVPERDDGDLLVRVRPHDEGGWQVLARTTPRPLSVRPYRVCDLPGGLDAALAAALLRWAGLRAEDRVCNPMLGSGTLLIERALAGPAACLHGFDRSPEAVACAQRNAAVADVAERVQVWQGDVSVPAAWTPDGSALGRYDLLLVDPPWGDAVGAHAANAALYAELLRAAAQRAATGARLLLITHEVRLAERLLAQAGVWRVDGQRRVWQGGHRPLCLLLTRLPGPV